MHELNRLLNGILGGNSPQPKDVKHTFKGRQYTVNGHHDTFRQKVYRGEDAAFTNWTLLDDGDFEAAKRFCNKVLKSATWLRIRKQHGMVKETCPMQNRGTFRFSDGRGTNRAKGGGGWLNLPRWCRTKHILLHEIAHNLVGASKGHHWPFCRAYIDLVAVFISKADAQRLERELKKAGAKTRPPKQYSEETMAKLRQRGHELAAARKKKQEEGK